MSIAAHELRGPVSAIQLASGALQQTNLPEVTRARALKLVEREAQRLTQFAGNIADITRVRDGALRFNDEDIDLVEIVNGSKAQLAVDLQRSGSTLSVTAPLPVIGRWDRNRMTQVVAALLSNAIKFGLGRPIEITVEASGGWATLLVRDHGLGVPPAKREQIFSPFERAVSASHYGGLGLGLFVLLTIVNHYGGSAVVAPVDGDGSRFMVRIPQARTA
jgi:signal transduction histidine kinase